MIKPLKKQTATHQFELHDAHTVPQDVRGRPQQLCEGIQSVVFEGRTSNLETRSFSGQTMHVNMHQIYELGFKWLLVTLTRVSKNFSST